jgi:hypothetical protein
MKHILKSFVIILTLVLLISILLTGCSASAKNKAWYLGHSDYYEGTVQELTVRPISYGGYNYHISVKLNNGILLTGRSPGYFREIEFNKSQYFYLFTAEDPNPITPFGTPMTTFYSWGKIGEEPFDPIEINK